MHQHQAQELPLAKAEPLEESYRSALINAWISVRLEEDKTLVTLSAGGIGLLVTLLTAIGLLKFWHVYLYVLAFSGFFISICSALSILRKNAEHIERILKQDQAKTEESSKKLKQLDNVAKWGFLFGLLMTIALGITLGLGKIQGSRTSQASVQGKLAMTSQNSRVTKE